MSEPINKDRTPTPNDIIILRWMESGQSINNLEAIQRFKNAMLRDAIWRLKKAGYPIIAEWVVYTTKEGKDKKYKRYYITKPEMIEAGFKTNNEAKAYKKKEKTAAEYAGDIIAKTKKPKLSDIYNGNTLFNQQNL